MLVGIISVCSSYHVKDENNNVAIKNKECVINSMNANYLGYMFLEFPIICQKTMVG